MATRRATSPARAQSRDNRLTELGEKFAAMEAEFVATMRALPAQMALAVKEGIAELAPRSDLAKLEVDHRALTDRVMELEKKAGYSAGAQKVEERVRGRLHEWLQTAAPLVWALAAAVLAARVSLQGLA